MMLHTYRKVLSTDKWEVGYFVLVPHGNHVAVHQWVAVRAFGTEMAAVRFAAMLNGGVSSDFILEVR